MRTTGAEEGEAFRAAAAAAALQAAEFSAPQGRAGRAGDPTVPTKAGLCPPGRPVRMRGRTRSVTANEVVAPSAAAFTASAATSNATPTRHVAICLH